MEFSAIVGKIRSWILQQMHGPLVKFHQKSKGNKQCSIHLTPWVVPIAHKKNAEKSCGREHSWNRLSLQGSLRRYNSTPKHSKDYCWVGRHQKILPQVRLFWGLSLLPVVVACWEQVTASQPSVQPTIPTKLRRFSLASARFQCGGHFKKRGPLITPKIVGK